MIIRCPKCHFSRTVDDSAIPASAQMATCPKCKHRFNFRETPPSAAAPETAVQTPETAAPGAEEPVAPEDAARRYAAMSGQPDAAGRKEEAESGEQRDIWSTIEAMGDQWENKNARPGTDRFAGSARPQRAAASQPFDASGIPWETSRGADLFSAFFVTIFRAIFSAPRFFSGLSARRSSFRAVLFYLLVNLVPAFLNTFILLLFHREDVNLLVRAFYGADAQVTPLLLIAALLIAVVVQALIFLFFFTGLVSIFLHLAGATGISFGKTTRLVAYAAAPTILTFIPVIGMLSLFLGMAVLAQGLRYAYGLSWRAAVIVMLPPYLLVFILAISALRAFLPMLA